MKWYRTIWGEIIIVILIALFILTGFSIFSLIFTLLSISKLKIQLQKPRVVISDDIEDFDDQSQKDVGFTDYKFKQTQQIQQLQQNKNRMEKMKKNTQYLLDRFKDNEDTLNKQISARNELLDDFKECVGKTNEIKEEMNKCQLKMNDFSTNLFENFKQTSDGIEKQVNDEIKEQANKIIMEHKSQSNIVKKHLGNESGKLKVFSDLIEQTTNANREIINETNTIHKELKQKTNQTIHNILQRVDDLGAKINPIHKAWKKQEDKKYSMGNKMKFKIGGKTLNFYDDDA